MERKQKVIDEAIDQILNSIYQKAIKSEYLKDNDINLRWFTYKGVKEDRVEYDEWCGIATQMIALDIIKKEDGYYKLTGLGYEIGRQGGWIKYLQKKQPYKRPFWKRITVAHFGLAFTIIFGTLAAIANWDKITATLAKLSPKDSKLEQPTQQPFRQDSNTNPKHPDTHLQHSDTATLKTP